MHVARKAAAGTELLATAHLGDGGSGPGESVGYQTPPDTDLVSLRTTLLALTVVLSREWWSTRGWSPRGLGPQDTSDGANEGDTLDLEVPSWESGPGQRVTAPHLAATEPVLWGDQWHCCPLEVRPRDRPCPPGPRGFIDTGWVLCISLLGLLFFFNFRINNPGFLYVFHEKPYLPFNELWVTNQKINSRGSMV